MELARSVIKIVKSHRDDSLENHKNLSSTKIITFRKKEIIKTWSMGCSGDHVTEFDRFSDDDHFARNTTKFFVTTFGNNARESQC